jgi:hypothetical protein
MTALSREEIPLNRRSTRVDRSAILGGRSGSDLRALRGARCNVLILGSEVRNRTTSVGS